MSLYRRCLPPVALAGCALALALITHVHQEYKATQRSYGCYTAGQILDRSESLCRLLAPRADLLRLTAEHSTPNAAHPCWNITCANQTGQEIAYFTWDAMTGELWCFGVPPYPVFRITGKPLTSHEAVSLTGEWLRVAGIAVRASHWQSTGTPQRYDDIWTVCWQTEDRRARVWDPLESTCRHASLSIL